MEAKALGLPSAIILHPAIENLKAVDQDGMIGTSSAAYIADLEELVLASVIAVPGWFKPQAEAC